MIGHFRIGAGVAAALLFAACESEVVGLQQDSGAGPADAVVADAGTTDARSSDAGTSDVGVADNETADSGTVDIGTVDIGTAEAGTADAETADSGTADIGTADIRTADIRTADIGTADNGTADAWTADVWTADVRTSDSAVADAAFACDGPCDDELPLQVGDMWAYRVGSDEPCGIPPLDCWTAIDFDDSGWSRGPSGFGYSTTASTTDDCAADVNTDLSNEMYSAGLVSLYLRTSFHVDDPANVTALDIVLNYDDGVIAYINGNPVVEQQMPATPSVAHFDTLAVPPGGNHECGSAETFVISGPQLDGLLLAGENVLAIQGHNVAVTSSDFALVPILSATIIGALPEECGDGISNDGDLEIDEGCTPCQSADFSTAENRLEAAPPPVFSAGLIEASGIVASRANPGVLWVHNDNSGDKRIFAIDAHGNYLGRYSLDFGPAGSDPEDIAAGPGPAGTGNWIYFGDIGNNAQSRNRLLIRWVAEPAVSLGQAPVTESITTGEALYLRYPNAETYDAECLLVDPVSKDLFVLTKRVANPRIFRAPYPLSTTQDNVMIYEGEAAWGGSNLTGGDISSDGSQIALTRYGGSHHWFRAPGSTVAETLMAGPGIAIPKSQEDQGEAICFDYQGYNVLTISEWVGSTWETPDANKVLHHYARNCP